MATIANIEQAIRSPKFSHGRSGTGLYRGSVLIYHFDETSPSGVVLNCVGPEDVVDKLIREVHNTSAISPVEPR